MAAKISLTNEDIPDNIIRAVPHAIALKPTEERTTYSLSPEPISILDTNAIIARLHLKGINLDTMQSFSAALRIFFEEVAVALRENHSVHLDLVYLSLSIRGILHEEDLNKKLEPPLIDLRVSTNTGPLMANATQGLAVYARPFVKLLPRISHVTNPIHGINNTVNPGNTVQIIGDNIFIAGDNAEVGVTFTSVADPSVSIHIPVNHFPVNKYKEIQFVLPAQTAPGVYTVSIATQVTTAKDKPVQDLRKSLYSQHVTVVA
ncbi:MAG: DUF4469 domain-containing protein [Spirochaetaceae bacterium]|jgi:hypothetical protein|nr:DUF4469 domain-containing protein [Spirochaetaceae bacterium]